MVHEAEDHVSLIASPAPEPRSKMVEVRELFDDFVAEARVIRVLSKGFMATFVVLALWIAWFILPLGGLQTERVPKGSSRMIGNLHNYFGKYEGFSECNIRAAELYSLPPKDDLGFHEFGTFCHDRRHLLQALSTGGRLGFDAPYTPRGCTYKWFDVEDMCFILERFDGLVFVGDETLQTIYSGLNILLRQDLALGAMDLTSMEQTLQEECRCSNQFVKLDCRQHGLVDSDKTKQENSDRIGSPYFCNRIRHAFLHIDSAQPGPVTIDKFKQLVPKAPRSQYRPIPIVHSVGPAMPANDAAASLLKFVELADGSGRNTPILWVGPTAAGHIDLKERKGNQEIWDFDRKMAATARENDVDVLGMWNMTVQATSFDGMRFGEKVAITQAMMVLNWLSRLESS